VLQGHAREATVWVGWRPGAQACEILRVEGATLEQARRCALRLDGSLRESGERWSRQAGLVEVARWGQFTEAARVWEGFGRV